MSVSFEINAQPRTDTGTGASRRLRRQGLVPAIVYGAHQDPQMIALSHNELLRHLEHESFYSHVLDLKIGDQVNKVVLKDMQRHPARPFILHLDFMRVSQDEKIRMTVPLHFVNEDRCKGVKRGGVVSHTITEIEIVCLPKDLPEFIAVDMTEMELGSILHLSELRLPEGVALAHAPDPDKPVVVIHGAHGDSEEAESA
ncbi:50S ribosomal protein L25/general stress protein Ctc [Thermochromatium tepidum]|jgi:LSU ribosomal protein L25P|uniref:Large ribosomal subunit protein bL25 n=1 Tax=Thermochromatium tepidum ATCC 43061 TaxID=316276 RepID=A0A6I6DZE0_THETI|nr:50S ribosomal protein L25/general stress protein Ctc [Thermochromatium tepidum]QGU32984.1 50S ribosomal protein L25/general stress protein Ctc [Thermochromatium tepidum ATCC 43061]